MIKKILSIFSSAILICSTPQLTSATDTTNSRIKSIDAYIKSLVPSHSFNGCVLIAQNGKILLNKGYGKADFKKNINNTPDTKFLISSNTKTITAVAILQLAEKGKLKLTDTLNKYIPDYPRGKEITIKQLLTNSSGIYDFFEDNTYTKSVKHAVFSNYTPTELISLFKNKPLKFKPGSKFSYSNSGFNLLGYIIEKVSGKSYGSYIKENIFNKAGMNTAYYAPLGKIKKIAQPTSTSLYNNKYVKSLSFPNYTSLYSSGGISCTASDLYKFDMELLKSNSKLLNKKSISELHEGQINIPDSQNLKYSYGLFVSSNGTLWHNGHDYGYYSLNTMIPKNKAVIILLENVDPGSDISDIIGGVNDEIVDMLIK